MEDAICDLQYYQLIQFSQKYTRAERRNFFQVSKFSLEQQSQALASVAD